MNFIRIFFITVGLLVTFMWFTGSIGWADFALFYKVKPLVLLELRQ